MREALGAWLSGAGPGGVSAGLCSHLGQLCRQDTTAELARCSRPTERDGMSSDQSARSSGRALDPGGQVWPCRVRNFRSRNPLGKGWAGPATSHPGRMGRGQGLEGAGRSRLERIVGPGWIGPGRARAGRPGPDIGLFRERPRSSSQTKLRPSIVSREDIPYFHALPAPPAGHPYPTQRTGSLSGSHSGPAAPRPPRPALAPRPRSGPRGPC